MNAALSLNIAANEAANKTAQSTANSMANELSNLAARNAANAIKYVVVILFDNWCTKDISNAKVYLHHHAREGTIGFVGGKKDYIVSNGIASYEDDEAAAWREFEEETGNKISEKIKLDETLEHEIASTSKVANISEIASTFTLSSSYKIRIIATSVLKKTKLFIVSLVDDICMDTQAWKMNKKTRLETAGIYAVKVRDLLACDVAKGEMIIDCPNFSGKLPIRGCAKNTFIFLQNFIKNVVYSL
jgi:hypothetical protein